VGFGTRCLLRQAVTFLFQMKDPDTAHYDEGEIMRLKAIIHEERIASISRYDELKNEVSHQMAFSHLKSISDHH